MWWSENAVSRWLERAVVAAFLTFAGFVGALLAYLVVAAEIAAVVPGRLGGWLIWHGEVIFAVALACGVAAALLVDRRAFARRTAA
jgi:hypothetical protein